MILLVGEDEDSILYFKTRIEVDEEMNLPFNVRGYRGRIGGEEVVVASIGICNMVTCVRVSMLISRFHPYLVFSVGSVVSVNSELHRGDILIADRYYFHGIDFTGDGQNHYGQIPGFPQFLTSDTNVNNQAEAACFAVGGAYVERGFLLSGDKDYFTSKEFQGIIDRHFLGSTKMSAYDNSSAGVALACHLGETALLTIKSVSYEPDKPEQFLARRRKGLEASTRIGEIIIAILVRNHEVI